MTFQLNVRGIAIAFFAIAMTGLTTKPLAAQVTGQGTLDWLETVTVKRLDYHCLVKFGTQDGVFEHEPKHIGVKWDEINAVPDRAVDSSVRAYVTQVEKYERAMQALWKETRNGMFWLFVRTAAEGIGGRDVEDLYNQLDDRLPVKQSVEKIAAMVRRRLLEGDPVMREEALLSLVRAVQRKRSEMEKHVKATYPTMAGRILERIDAPVHIVTVARHEKQWLSKNRPGRGDQQTIKSIRRIHTAKEELAKEFKAEYVADMDKYGGRLATIFVVRKEWCEAHEKELPALVANDFEQLVKDFSPAYREAMRRKKAALGGGVVGNPGGDPDGGIGGDAWFAQLHALQQATITKMKPTRYSRQPPRIVVRLDDVDTLKKMAPIAKPHLGFVGAIEAPEDIADLAVTADGKTLVVLCRTSVVTYNLETGKREKLIFAKKEGPRYTSMALSPKGDATYVMDDTPQVLRVVLNEGVGRIETPYDIKLRIRESAIAVTPDGEHMAVIQLPKADIYSTKTGKVSGKPCSIVYNAMIYFARFSEDGRILLLGGNDYFATPFDWRTGKAKPALKQGQFGMYRAGARNVYVYSAAQTKSGRVAVGGAGYFSVYKVNAPEPHLRLSISEKPEEYKYRFIDILPDDEHVINEHGVWNIKTEKEVVAWSAGITSRQFAMTPDGRRFIHARGKYLFVAPIITGPKPLKGRNVGKGLAGDGDGKDAGDNAGNSDANTPDTSPTYDVKKAETLIEQANLYLKNNLKSVAKKKLEAIIKLAPDSPHGVKAKAMLDALK